MADHAAAATPHPFVVVRLSVMMFLQYGMLGVWQVLFYPFLTEFRGITPDEAGQLFAYAAIGALTAPFVAGQIVDRWFHTERYMAISHVIGAFLVWQMAVQPRYEDIRLFTILYSIVYMPTLSLASSMTLRHAPDRDRDFGKVMFWGGCGWIVTGIAMAQWLSLVHSPAGLTAELQRQAVVAGMGDAFKLAAILGVLLGAYCFTLPATPPLPSVEKFAALKSLMDIQRSRALLILFLLSFPMACMDQFYWVHAATYLEKLPSLQQESGSLNRFLLVIFGEGGGGLMTIGQIVQLIVMAFLPYTIARFSRKTLLLAGVAAYALRFAIFAWLPYSWAVLPGLALHGFCYTYFYVIAYMIVDEESSADVRGSAQTWYNLVTMGAGAIVGGMFAGWLAQAVTPPEGSADYVTLFAVPTVIVVACLVLFQIFYPARRVEPVDNAFFRPS